VEDAVQVHIDHPLPRLEGEVGEALEPVETGRVDQDGDRAQALPDGRQRGVYPGRIRHVGHLAEWRLRRLGRVEIEDGDVVAVRAQPPRNGQPDAGAAAGDDGGLHERASSATAVVRYRAMKTFLPI
jgi:hypothetical protein